MQAVLTKLTGPRREGHSSADGLSASTTSVSAAAPLRESRLEMSDTQRHGAPAAPHHHVSQSRSLDPASVVFLRKEGGAIEKIGQGQYPIYKAEMMILGKRKLVAVKAFDPDDREDFEKEVAVQSKMRHPCLLTLIGWCEKDDMLCLVMPLKKGGDLRRMIYDMTIELPLSSVVPVFEDVLRGLRYLHSRSILHRDLKPENILLNKARTRAKISDFGTTRQSANAMTVFAVGTVEYCAPEVFHSAEYDSAVDIFSLGVIIWECLTRTKPWAELKQPLALKVEKKLTAGERPIIPPATPNILRDLISACWAYNPAERPTADELLTKWFPRLKEQLCPELIARQPTRPMLGLERGRAMVSTPPREPHSQGSTPPPPMQPPRGSYITREDRSSGDGHTVAGSWIAGRRKSPLPAVCASPAPIPPVPAAAGAQPLISPKSGSARFPDEEKPLPLVDGLDLHDKQESSSLPDTKSVMPVD